MVFMILMTTMAMVLLTKNVSANLNHWERLAKF